MDRIDAALFSERYPHQILKHLGTNTEDIPRKKHLRKNLTYKGNF